MFVLLICEDLFFGSKVSGAAAQAGVTVVVDAAASLARISDADCTGVLLDLNHSGITPAEVAERSSTHQKLLAYGPHVHTELFEAAALAGFETITRGQLDRSTVSVLQSFDGHGGAAMRKSADD